MTIEARRAGRGFTLVELLIVIAIITILIVLSLAVAGKVTGTGKVRSTEQIIRALDQSLNDYIAEKGSIPPATVIDPRPANTGTTRYIQPVADARSDNSGQIINSVGLYMAQCKGIPSAEAAFKSIDSKFIREYNPEAGASAASYQDQPTLPTVFDAWGKPIRYVHPVFKGLLYGPDYANQTDPTQPLDIRDPAFLGPAQPGRPYGIYIIRRNNSQTGGGPDSDGGVNPGTRPYFYSCGPDGDPSTVDDNIYITKPQVQR